MTTDLCSWRDLIHDLTEAQVKYFTEAEGHGEEQSDLLIEAQYSAVNNAGSRIFFANMPIPAGATAISMADPECADGIWTRAFSGDRQIIGDEDVDSVQVQISGRQFPDGRLEQWVDFLVEGGDEPDHYSRRHLNPSRARAVAHMLLNAANQIDPKSETEPIGVVGPFAYYPHCADPAQTATLNVSTRFSAPYIASSSANVDDPHDVTASHLRNTDVTIHPDTLSLLGTRLSKVTKE